MLKKIYLLIGLLVATISHAQLNTFSEGDVISAEQMNENFQALINSNVIRATTVNCDDGETINGAIEIGYNDITVSGTCSENLLFSVWRDSSVDDRTPSGKLAPRYLRLSGADTNAKIMDASSNYDSVISVSGGTTLVLEGIIISGGQWGVSAARNSNLLMTGGVTVEGFTERGIQVFDSSYLGVDEGGVTIQGGSSANYGIYLEMGANAWVHTTNISNIKTGVNLFGGSFLYLHDFSINASNSGIRFSKSTVRQYGDGVGLIQGTSESAVQVGTGIFETSNEATLTISNLNGGKGINLWQSQADINNLKMLDFNNKGSGDNPAIKFFGSNVGLGNIEISGSTDGGLLNCDKSILNIENLNISGNSDDALVGFFGCKIWMANTVITGEANTLLDIGSSEIKIKNTSVTGKSYDSHLVYIGGNSGVSFRENSTITASEKNGIFLSGLSSLDFRDSTLSAKASTLNIQENSLATIRNSSVNAADGYGVEVVRGSGLRIYAPSTILATNDPAILARQAAWVEVNDGLGTVINRTDSGADISLNSASFMAVGEKNVIEEIECSFKSYVQADDGTVTTLSSSCTE